MADTIDYESLTREERIRRIGALLSKAVTLFLAQQHAAPDADLAASDIPVLSATIEGTSKVDALQGDDLALLKRFAISGEFSPREAIQFWGISRTSAYRRLRRLEEAGWIVKNGNTNAVRYRITAQVHPVLKQLKQVR